MPSIARQLARLRRVRLTLVALLLASSVAVGIHRGTAIKHDFRSFYNDARHLATGGDLTDSALLEWYLPGFRILISPMGRLPPAAAAAVWNVLNLMAAIVALWALSKAIARARGAAATGDDRAESSALFAWLLSAPLIAFNLQTNQISLWPLALLALAFLARQSARWRSAAVLVALAAFVKIVPALLLGYFVLRRRLSCAATVLLLPLAISFAVDAAAGGPSSAWRHHAHWYRIAVTGSTGTAFFERRAQLYHGNQGLGAVLGRLLHPPPPPKSDHTRRVRDVHIATLDPSVIRAIYRAIVAASLLALAAITLRARRDADGEFGVFSIWCVAVIWLAPLARQYYEVWAMPALWYLADRRLAHRAAGRRSVAPTLGLAAWLVGLIGWMSPELRAAGVNQWVNLLVMLAVGWEVADRRGDAKPEPHACDRC